MALDVDKIMWSPRLKVQRANSHIDSLISQSSPLSKHLYDIGIERVRSNALLTKLDCLDLTFRPKEPIPEHFSLIMGDVVHNLHSSLDHWASALISELSGNPRDLRIYFPFVGEGQNLETTPTYKAIEKAFPDAAKFIRDEIQPCWNGNRKLWCIGELDNIDKHNFILPTVTVVMVENINANIGGYTIKDCSFRGNAANPIRMMRSPIGTPFSIQENFKTSAEVTFPQGSLFENESVVPTLLQLKEIVAKALDSLERFLRTI